MSSLWIMMPHHTGAATADDDSGPQTIEQYGTPQEAVELQAFGGRVNEYEDLATVSKGVLRQQFDGTATLDLSGVAVDASEVLTGTTSTGQAVTIAASRQAVKGGWGNAQYYMLEVNANEDIVVEPGDHHRMLYISMDPAAWSRSTIATDYNSKNGTSLTSSNINGTWLLANPFYGSTQAEKVNPEVGKLIYDAFRSSANFPNLPSKIRPSPHIGVERGYTYPTSLNFNGFAQSPLHPIYVFAYGTGHDPVVSFSGNGATYHSNFVFVGIIPTLTSNIMSFENWLVADILGSHEIGTNAVHGAAGMTLYRTAIHDVVTDAPRASSGAPGGTSWNEHRNITCGTFIASVHGVYFLDTYWDHNGWADGYSTSVNSSGDLVADGVWNNGEFGQPPTIYSHNIYTQYNNADMTWDGMINMRASSIAGQMRIGGWQWRMSSINNPVTSQNIGQPYDYTDPTSLSFWSQNFKLAGTHAANRPYLQQQGGQGAKQWGFGFAGPYEVDIDCAIFNRLDPDDYAAELAYKGPPGGETSGTQSISKNSRFPALYSSVMSLLWSTSRLGTEGISEDFVKTITIQRRAGIVLNRGPNGRGTLEEYANYVESLTPRGRQLEVRALNRYLLQVREPTLEVALEERTVVKTLHFKPDWRGEGFRLDSPINLNYIEGSDHVKTDIINGDSLNLHSNYAKWVGRTRSLAALTVGAGGELDVNSGRVSFTSATPGARVKTSNSGKFYASAFDGHAVLRGGRFAVTAASAGSVDASGQGQLILGPDWTVRDDEIFRLIGDMGQVGWDRVTAANSKLTIKAGGTLEFEATPVITYGAQSDTFGGHAMNPWMFHNRSLLGQTSGAKGKFDSLIRSNGKAHVRIRDIEGTPVVGEHTTAAYHYMARAGLIEAIHPATIGKIEAGWAARLGTVNTTATFQVILEAGSFLKVKNRDRLDANTYDLGGGTGTRVTFVDNGATKDAGFAVTGGKLTLTI